VPGISAETLHQLKNALIRCGPFGNAASLSAIFVDDRLYPWKSSLPITAGSIEQHVDITIDILHDEYNRDFDNVLVLFLRVLAERTDPKMGCYPLLMELASQLEQELTFDHDQLPAGLVAVGGPAPVDHEPPPGKAYDGAEVQMGLRLEIGINPETLSPEKLQSLTNELADRLGIPPEQITIVDVKRGPS